MEALGRLFNLAPTMDGVAVNLEDAAAVTFIGVGADTYTLTTATVFAGPYADPAVDCLDHVYVNANADGTTAWTEQAVSPAADVVISAAAAVALHVSAKSLPDGQKYVMCTSTGAGLVIAILHDLEVQRSPVNLPAISAA